MADIGNVKAELMSKLVEVKKRKEEAARKNEEITFTVKKWLNDVEAILQEVQKLQQEAEGGGKKRFNMSLKYSTSKQMANKAKQIMELKNNSNFEPFSYPIELPGITHFTSKEFVEFESRKSTYNNLLEAIRDDKNKVVGLYGMVGSGKTTLAKEVGKKLVDEMKLFNKVVVVNVSKPPNVEIIQQDIAKQVGLEFQEQCTAEMLRTELKYRKILIILDNLQSKLSLEDIGIPLDEGCCILLTTCLRSVYDSMGCDNKIELPLLNKEDAWAFLQMHANITDSPNVYDSVGRKIVDECKWLPLAIVAVGSTLKEKRVGGWVTALWKLQHTQPSDVEEDLRSLYACIKLSYDNLPSPTAKSLFLLCSMFPEDCKINKEDLIRFGRGMLKLDENVDTMEDTRRKILLTIKELIDYHLLMPTEEQAYVKMHDVVRDVALFFGKRRKAFLVESHEVSKMLQKNESIKGTKVISLWNLDENFMPLNQLRCPTLEILLLHPKEFIDYFRGVEALKILALIQFSFTWNTFRQERTRWLNMQSIVSLTNLHTLCLRGIALGNIFFLDKLKRLEFLDLRGSSFDELPVGIAAMEKLKLLDLFGCSIQKSPYEIIQKCLHLQELYLWDRASTIPKDLCVPKLERYVICDPACSFASLGPPSLIEYLDDCVEALRTLSINGLNVSVLSSSLKDLILRANILWMENYTWDIDINSEIKHLVVLCCPNRKVIVDNLDDHIPQTKQVFSNLITLRLSEMNDLERVFHGSSISCSLQKLQELCIENCPQLHDICFPNSSNLSCLKTLKLDACPMLKLSIFTPSIAQSLVVLEKLYIRGCGHLKDIIAGSEEEENAADSNSTPRTSSMEFQNLRILNVDSCAELGSILPLYFAQSLLRLESLDVRSTPKLKYVIGGRKDDHRRNENKDPMEFEVYVPSLTKILFRDMHEPISLFPQQIHPSATGNENDKVWMTTLDLKQLQNQVLAQHLQGFLNLKSLSIQSCRKNKGIFELQVRGAVDGDPVVTQEHLKLNSELCELYLDDLLELEFIWKGPTQSLSLHRLERVELMNCPRLTSIFTPAIVMNLPELSKLDVRKCSELVGIFSTDSLKNLSASSASACFPKLNSLTLESLPKLREIFPSFENKESVHHIQDSTNKNENDRVREVNSLLCYIELINLGKLEYIWKAPMQTLILDRLEQVTLWKCSKLRAIFPCTTVPTSLPKLRQLKVTECEEWEGLFSSDSVENLSSASSPKVFFPELRKIWIGHCNKLRCLFSFLMASRCHSLETMVIHNCCELDRVVDGGDSQPKLFPKLNHLILTSLPNLRKVYPGYPNNHLLSGNHVIYDCPNIRQDCLLWLPKLNQALSKLGGNQ